MNTSTTPEPNSPTPGPIRIGGPVLVSAPPPAAPAETAPSALLAEGPAFARFLGFVGLFFLVLGAVVVISTRVLGPRWVPEGFGYLSAAFGLALMLYHSVTDSEQEIRRLYGGGAAFLLLFAIVASLVPGPFEGTSRSVGYFLLPWGVGAGFLSLLFAIPFTRHETDSTYHNIAGMILLTVGGALAAGSVVAGIFKPDFLAGPGIALALLGLGFLCVYLSQIDTTDGIGYSVAFAVGAFGALVLVYAIIRSTFPTLLHDGPTTLRKPIGALDWWRVSFRVLAGVAFLVPAIIAFAGRAPGWLKGALALFGVAGAGVVVLSLFNNPVHSAPRPFLVPGGLILMVLGITYLAVALGICSDNQFVTLTRRELSAYFLSPIGYLVLGSMALIEWNQYRIFISELRTAGLEQVALEEPIVRGLLLDLIPAFLIIFIVPLLTMRLVSEEKRAGSLEVLLTAPVNELPVVLSKFVATWLFYLLCWLPFGLFLIALRIEVPEPFDYRPLLSFYACIAAQGLAFIGMGLFFSTLTKNQIISAVLTLVGMIGFILCFYIRRDPEPFGIPPFIQAAVSRLSYVHMWIEALSGRLPLRDCLLFASLGLFWLFLSVKVLETRKWN